MASRSRKSSRVVSAVHGLGVVLLEAAALAAVIWLIALRAGADDSPDLAERAARRPITLFIEGWPAQPD